MRLYSDQNVQHVQQLPLVFVQTLGLRIEQGIGVEGGVLMTGQPGAEMRFLFSCLMSANFSRKAESSANGIRSTRRCGILDATLSPMASSDQLGQARVGATSASGGA